MLLKKNKIALIFFLIFIIILPHFLNLFKGGAYYVAILIPVGIFSLTAIGLILLFGFAGQVSLGHAGFMCIGAYSSVFVSNKLGYSPAIGFIIGIAVSSLIGFIISKPILKLKGHYLAMATLGIGIIIEIIFRELRYFGGGEGISCSDLKVFNFNFNDTKHKELSFFYLVWIINFIAITMSINFIQSKAGRALKALHINEIAAKSLGIDVTRYKTFIFTLSAAFAAVSGSLIAHYNSYVLPFSFDLHISIKLICIVILGGSMNICGAPLGAFILLLLPELMGKFDEYEGIVYGGIIILTMIFLPQGLISLFYKKIRVKRAE